MQKKPIKSLTFNDILKQSAKEGLDIFESFTMFKEEFERSVINLYPTYEKDIK